MSEESKLAEKLENQTKFSDEDLKTVKEIQNEYSSITSKFGHLSISKIKLESQLNSLQDYESKLNEDFINLQNREREFLEGTTKKYGEGSLNPETGEFTPNK